MSSTRETIDTYFANLKAKGDWQALLTKELTFTNFASPVKRVVGREAFIEATRRFYSSVTDVTVRDVLVDGDCACVLTHYDLHPPGKSPFVSDVAEIFRVSGGKISSLEIYFDSAPFPKEEQK